jgi:hypothetical protein
MTAAAEPPEEPAGTRSSAQGFADDDRAGFFQVHDDLRVLVGNAIVEDGAGSGGSRPGGVDVVFERNRNSVQRTAKLARFGFRIQLRRLGQSLLAHHGDECVEFGIVDFDAVEQRLGQFGRSDFARVNAFRSFAQ